VHIFFIITVSPDPIFAESDEEHKRQERVSSLPPGSFEGFCMDCEPLFCFETAIKLAFWCFAVYQKEGEAAHGTVEAPQSHESPKKGCIADVKHQCTLLQTRQSTPFAPSTAMELFDLCNYETIWEPRLDSKAIIGWSDDCVVISFRGTSSVANVLADLQVWRVRHPRDIGSPFLGTAPMVHQGFLKAYTVNNFNDRLLGAVESILNRCVAAQMEDQARPDGGTPPPMQRPVQVYVSGHSLGGALAVLCAYDIATRGPCAEFDLDVRCYTFGAPRVGNHAWAREYNAKVPDTWQIINSDDAVTRAGKFGFLYKVMHSWYHLSLN